jgi:hypothetical protein
LCDRYAITVPVRLRQPELQPSPFPARTLRAECAVVVSGPVRLHSLRSTLALIVAKLRHDLRTRLAAVSRFSERR